MRDSIVQRLSAGCEVITADVEEHVMVSVATGWKDGQRVWSVTHDAQREMEHLQAEGELPAVFTSIRDRLRAEQQEAGGRRADVDHLFDVPVELAQTLTGYATMPTFRGPSLSRSRCWSRLHHLRSLHC